MVKAQKAGHLGHSRSRAKFRWDRRNRRSRGTGFQRVALQGLEASFQWHEFVLNPVHSVAPRPPGCIRDVERVLIRCSWMSKTPTPTALRAMPRAVSQPSLPMGQPRIAHLTPTASRRVDRVTAEEQANGEILLWQSTIRLALLGLAQAVAV